MDKKIRIKYLIIKLAFLMIFFTAVDYIVQHTPDTRSIRLIELILMLITVTISLGIIWFFEDKELKP